MAEAMHATRTSQDAEDDSDDVYRNDRMRTSMTKRILALIGLQYIKFLQNFLIGGISVVMVVIIESYGSSRTLAVNIQTVFAGTSSIAALVGGITINRLGAGKIIVAGCFAFAVGMFIAFFVQTIELFIVFGSMVPGLAAGMIIPCCIVSTKQLAGDDRRTRYWITILQISTTTAYGAGPIIADVLIQFYGWRGSLLIFSCIGLQGIPIGYFISTTESTHCSTGKSVKDIKNKFKNIIPVLIFITVVVSVIMQESPASYVIDMVFSKGFPRSDASWIYTSLSFCGLIGQFGIMVLVKKFHPNFVILTGVFCLLHSVITCVQIVSYTYVEIMVVASLAGVAMGALSASFHIIMTEEFEEDILGLVVGLIGVVVGTIQVGTGPLIGYIRDETGSYDVYLYVLLVISAITAGITTGVSASRYLKRKNERGVSIQECKEQESML